MNLPDDIQDALDAHEDEIAAGRAVFVSEAVARVATWVETHHADVLPEILDHGFTAASLAELELIFDDESLREFAQLPPDAPIDDEGRLAFMDETIAEVLDGTSDEFLPDDEPSDHLRCGMFAVPVGQAEAVIALAEAGTPAGYDEDEGAGPGAGADDDALRFGYDWLGLFPGHEAFEDYLTANGYVTDIDRWRALPREARLAHWGRVAD